MGRAERLYARVSPRLAHGPGSVLATRAHAALLRASRGRIGRRMFRAEVILLRTTGRRSGEPREAPVFAIREGESLVTCASNAASKRPPAWWLNLQSRDEAEAFVAGTWRPVVGRRATPEEEARLWPKLDAVYEGYEHYRSLATRELPVVILEPRR